MSSMRNAVQRRPHKERAQPASRSKWGILEKHKDYTLRAQDYNLKQRKLSTLRRKAADRNPDEFAFGMMSQDKRGQGKHGSGSGQALSNDAVKLLKTQDAGYLRLAEGKVRRELGAVEREVGMEEVMGESGKGDGRGKVVFVDSVEEQQRRRRASGRQKENVDADNEEIDMTEVGDTKEVQIEDKQIQRKSQKQLRTEHDALAALRAARKRRKRVSEARQAKLEALKKRQKEIMAAERELEWQRARMTNSVGGVNKWGVKWKVRERKT